MPSIMSLEGPNVSLLGGDGLTCLSCPSLAGADVRTSIRHYAPAAIGLLIGGYLAYTGWTPRTSGAWGSQRLTQAKAKLGLAGSRRRRRR